MRSVECPNCQAKIDMARQIRLEVAALKSLLSGESLPVTCDRCAEVFVVRSLVDFESVPNLSLAGGSTC